MKIILKIILKIIGAAVSGLLALVLLTLLVLNAAKFFIYADYYDIKTDICKNPGLSDGFVCQGICADEDDGKILVSGYMKDGSASRIYITDTEDNSHYITLTKDGKDFSGHLGGVAYLSGCIYIADGGRIYPLSAEELLGVNAGESLEIGEGVKVNNSASFIYADDEHIYVGEFHNGAEYVTDHPYDNPDGTYHAIVSRYSPNDLTAPELVYSIRDKVQGFCMIPEGKIVLSTSYGLSDSVYYVYEAEHATDTGETLDGAPVLSLCSEAEEIKGPAMSEGLDYYEGRVITLTESASDKYIFGKFFFANKIVGLEIK